MANKVKLNLSVAPESNYEIRRLAKAWDIPISQAWERCVHYVASVAKKANIYDTANVRQAEAKVEMLKSR